MWKNQPFMLKINMQTLWYKKQQRLPRLTAICVSHAQCSERQE
jgi:hypothetical protein